MKTISYEASPAARACSSQMGRTEDIAFSPDNRFLALAEFLENRIVVFSVRVDSSSDSTGVAISDCTTISSSQLRGPHGVSFLGTDHVVVSNRGGDVCVFKVPAPGTLEEQKSVKPVGTISGRGFLTAKVKTPGSVACYPLSKDCYQVLVCNGSWHMVTAHQITVGRTVRIQNRGVLIERGLRIPDGIAISPDHAWIAVSNHADGEVLIYENGQSLGRTTVPVATLSGIVCPHGIRFSPDGQRVFVTDAASQYLRVYERLGPCWNGPYHPAREVRLLSDTDFYRGRHAPGEGGNKGIAIDGTGAVLAATRKGAVLQFYDVKVLLTERSAVDHDEIAGLTRQRDVALRKTKTLVFRQRWTLSQRVRHAAVPSFNWRRYTNAARSALRMAVLYARNLSSSATILDPLGPVVSMTTHGCRTRSAFGAIESIARGYLRPSRFILWVDESTYRNRPDTLRRLESRGLEVVPTCDCGPHTKYYPYLERGEEFRAPFATADDDTLYPPWWLQQLMEAYKADPTVIHCHRARRMELAEGRLTPYLTWEFCSTRTPSHLNLVTAVAGVIYPPEFLGYLKAQGRGFEQCCPDNDDIWVTVNALRAGTKISQVDVVPADFDVILFSQRDSLFARNGMHGGNQRQLVDTVDDADLSSLLAELSIERGTSSVEARS